MWLFLAMGGVRVLILPSQFLFVIVELPDMGNKVRPQRIPNRNRLACGTVPDLVASRTATATCRRGVPASKGAGSRPSGVHLRPAGGCFSSKRANQAEAVFKLEMDDLLAPDWHI